MNQLQQNKNFIIGYYNALSGVTKTRELVEQYVTDEELIGHILFFDSVLPRYEAFIDEMTAEDNRVVVRARAKGVHEGEFNGILPTHRSIEVHSMITYVIENGKIIHHTLVADQMELLTQLGVMNVPAGE
jgi:hypothetical protein